MTGREIQRKIKDFKELPFPIQYFCFENFLNNSHPEDLEYYKTLIEYKIEKSKKENKK